MTEDAQPQGYTQWAPPLAMADAVDAFWKFWVPRRPQQDAPLDRQHRVLPDGCTDLIFDFHHAPGPVWLARSLDVSERPLHRDILDEAGVSPKLLARVLRFQRAVSLLRANAGAALCDVALECGYADQAHLSREVRELAGVSPTALVG